MKPNKVTDMVCTCKNCKEEISWNNTITPEGLAEYQISGLCEKCFDDTCFDMEEWIDVLDEDILNVLGNGVVLAGGSLRTIVDPDEVIQDYDLFFTDMNQVQSVKKYLESKGYGCIFICPKGEIYTYYNESNNTKVQLITKFEYKDCNALIDSFDITACCCAYDGQQFYKNTRFVFDVLNKLININKIEYPVASIKRITKYISKGYRLSNEGASKFVQLVNAMQLDEDNTAFYID